MTAHSTRPLSETIIYELHVRGFTKSPSSGVEHPGTFAGIIEKIPYLKSLGITAVELLPIFDFDETQILRIGPTGQPLTNYWGYDPYGHWAPQSSYCVSPHRGSHLDEFRNMVKALHRAGIEVILDVVFNHTSEGNQNGPTISFRGQANEAYYMLSSADSQYYMDFSGCGNTFNANHPVVTKYIVECLEYWVTQHHVDGFRFDLGAVLSRGPDGAEMSVPPVLWNIELSRIFMEYEADRRSVGRRRALRGGQIPRQTLGAVERPFSGLRAQVRQVRRRTGRRPRDTYHGQQRPVRPARRNAN